MQRLPPRGRDAYASPGYSDHGQVAGYPRAAVVLVVFFALVLLVSPLADRPSTRSRQAVGQAPGFTPAPFGLPSFSRGDLRRNCRSLRSCRTQCRCIIETDPVELDAAVRSGGAVVLDVYAVWCPSIRL